MDIDHTLRTEKQQWWNRPLWGNKSLLDKFNEIVSNSLSTDKDILSLHNQGLIQAKVLAEAISNRDKQEFVNPEFIHFVKLKTEINKHKRLLKHIKLLMVLLELKDIFLVLGDIENRYQGFQEQNFYDFITELSEKKLTKLEFLTIINNKFSEDISLINNSNTRTALKSYKKGIEILAVNNLGLKLLNNFRKNQINYAIFLKKFNEMINILIEKKQIHHLSYLELFVNRNSAFFKQVNKVIELSESLNNSKNQALVIQYVGLNNKYQSDYLEFNEFLGLLTEWQQTYQVIMNIRREYGDTYQKIPKQFKQEIPGLEIYEKYNTLLS